MKIRLSDYITNFLVSKNINHVFLLSGGGFMHLLDAAGKQKGLEYICNQHEQACAMAADGYAKFSGGTSACFATSGPGGTNTITGVTGAWLDSTPVMFFTGQSKLSQTIRNFNYDGLRQFGFFEVDIIPIVKSITKYSQFIDDPKMIRYHLEKGYYLANHERPGPVFFDIPVDIQGAIIETDDLIGFDLPKKIDIVNDKKISLLIEKIKNSQKPVIIAGHGIRCSGQQRQFLDLLCVLNVPVVTTPLGKDIIEFQHELFIGHPGPKGDRAGNLAIQNSDLIITIGSSLHVSTTGYEIEKFAPDAYKIMIEIDEKIIDRQEVSIDKIINTDIKNFINDITKILNNEKIEKKENWLNYCKFCKYELDVMNEDHVRPVIDGKTSINFYDLVDTLGKLTTGNETIVTDAGSAFYIVGQSYKVKGNQRIINSGGLGSMGYALPASLGVTFATENSVICITGDGSLQLNIQEFATISHNNPNLKILVVNNNGYVSIRNTQNNFFKGNLVGSSEESGVLIPSLDKLCNAYNIKYNKVSILEELEESLTNTLNFKGPIVFEIFMPNEIQIIPTVSSMKLDDGSMISKPLDEMFPFHNKKQIEKYKYNEQTKY